MLLWNAGMQKLITASPTLAGRPEFRRIMTLKGLDVMATRLWFDKRVETRFPSNVLSGFEESTGGTFFNLNQLQAGPPDSFMHFWGTRPASSDHATCSMSHVAHGGTVWASCFPVSQQGQLDDLMSASAASISGIA